MPSKRDVLALLTRDELLAVVDRFDLVPPDRCAKEGLVETIASSKRATVAQALPGLPRDRLKEMCRALDLDKLLSGEVRVRDAEKAVEAVA